MNTVTKDKFEQQNEEERYAILKAMILSGDSKSDLFTTLWETHQRIEREGNTQLKLDNR